MPATKVSDKNVFWFYLGILSKDNEPKGCMKPSKTSLKPLPYDAVLDLSKVRAFADDKMNVTQKHKTCLGKGRKHYGKRRKCWLPHNVFKRPFTPVRQKLSLCGNGLKIMKHLADSSLADCIG